jgi:hypothetical protein
MQICSEENEEGNIEYKRYFNNINQNKLNQLTLSFIIIPISNQK